MPRMKFVSAKEPVDHAMRLFKVQQRVQKLKQRLDTLCAEEEQLKRYLLRVSKNQSFAFDGPKYQMAFKVTEHSRMILDQAACLRLLKSKTPYCKSEWLSVKVDYVYEKEKK